MPARHVLGCSIACKFLDALRYKYFPGAEEQAWRLAAWVKQQTLS
jgi:hypothetical protein